MDYPILDIRNEGGLVKDGASDLVKACDLFVYLNVQFRSVQFEEEVPSSQIFIIMNTQGIPLPQLTLRRRQCDLSAN